MCSTLPARQQAYAMVDGSLVGLAYAKVVVRPHLLQEHERPGGRSKRKEARVVLLVPVLSFLVIDTDCKTSLKLNSARKDDPYRKAIGAIHAFNYSP